MSGYNELDWICDENYLSCIYLEIANIFDNVYVEKPISYIQKANDENYDKSIEWHSSKVCAVDH